MTDEPMLLLLLGSGLAFAAAVLLWKLLMLTAGIAATQWLLVTGFADQPLIQAAVFAVPALLAACLLLYLPGNAGLSLRTRSGLAFSPFNPRRRARRNRWEAMA
ncbi:hypothetical protein [Lentzea cavernae]|uniref:Uncharacterized protein n=1 Tax=Lentzea cavernae TaxID=2020703 RepID=A0ABQ3MJC4_9PSEU|nr:hypothetical protein [Lentzea cavernae]GHH49258.1 hypothetical protein GCM10017774_56360 [Lentzea cavernae]